MLSTYTYKNVLCIYRPRCRVVRMLGRECVYTRVWLSSSINFVLNRSIGFLSGV